MKSPLQEERTDSFPKFSIVGDNFLWRSKLLLDSSFLVRDLFLSLALFRIAFLSSLEIKLQLFERICFIFLERACQEQITLSLTFDSGAFVDFSNPFYKS